MVSMLLSRRIFVYNSNGGNDGLSQMVYRRIGHDNGLPWNQNYPERLSKGNYSGVFLREWPHTLDTRCGTV